MDGENWKENVPTPEDMVKYVSQKTRLLVKVPWYQCPVEVVPIAQLLNGEVFQIQGGGWPAPRQWIMTREIEVIAIMPPRELQDDSAQPSGIIMPGE